MRKLHWVGIVAVVVLAVGGIAYADIPDSAKVIHSCYSQATGTWRPIDTETTPPQTCKRGETPLDWGQSGPPGPPGAPGAAGVENAYYESASSPINLPGSYTTILSLPLPAGSWSVSATVNLNNFSGQRVPVLCSLWSPTSQVNTVLAIAGLASWPGAGGDAITLPLSGTVTLNGAGTVELQCLSNTGTSAVAFAEGRQMTALSVSNLTVQP
jgi:hypothetical protein